ncbi:uracil-DNA glycosylase [Polycladidibacter stylochi]|uniref:uracil-DNA glycosylase n=1 Tax=Polycladidibacter stylochi TaxID=1807766 RepID=UPI00082B8F14|nr:uracil-DNA glycosylase [Pseudovibrio stylochi]
MSYENVAADVPLSAMEAYLEFLVSSGVDCCIDETPHDWFSEPATNKTTAVVSTPAPTPTPKVVRRAFKAEEAGHISADAKATAKAILQRQKQTVQQTQGSQSPQIAVLPDANAVTSARDTAFKAHSLEELRQSMLEFEGCNLRLTASNLVFGDGPAHAPIMFVGEAPGKEEDLSGVPFVGRSGQLLNLILKRAGIAREQVYIANVVPWRPPGNRTPTPQETEICRPFIQRQIELVDPKVLIFLGAASASALTGSRDGIRKLRGKWLTYKAGAFERDAMAMYHPAYLLRSPAEKKLVWRDILNVKNKLG